MNESAAVGICKSGLGKEDAEKFFLPSSCDSVELTWRKTSLQFKCFAEKVADNLLIQEKKSNY